MWLGVCHTQKVISTAKRWSRDEDPLQQNLSTHKPHTVFSVGPCQLVHEKRDGRLYVNVDLQQRVRLQEEVQTLPFRIAKVEVLDDQPIDILDKVSLTRCRDSIQAQLEVLGEKEPQLLEHILSEHWQQQNDDQFSMSLFRLLQFEADTQQALLAMTNPLKRLSVAAELLNVSG